MSREISGAHFHLLAPGVLENILKVFFFNDGQCEREKPRGRKGFLREWRRGERIRGGRRWLP